ncbi:NAD(P)-dependent oxidoreductase [Phytomonospora endophytica]|uniref:3-hydroxyisobutyrate dehydrogenase-like beta-hydroxyacid dehydrogenase n=1 Tax=Phytomonospora endophytica TaxID=714109 RepID=A0A841FTA8_9ACTN|nr:NAD(P)-binding domain-containing protein [Phytomonospora endophytica]MBB6036978.1 3-hydroxyisobutyrate dehydrogenase-like beta-hydroxyacid dehydrogenase [Phytomonospora endophytica]GIG67991.1 dehydrogenase [Phytomonospora endophytica]
MSIDKAPVTVIGLGPMGQAMVRSYLAAGHPVTVWNRTASRADDLVAEGARLAASPSEAVAASGLTILSLTDYAAMYAILDGVGDVLSGRVVANISSDSPERTREAGAWLADRGARLLTGGIMVPAPMVGTEQSYVFYSGPKEVMDAQHDTLAVIGRPDYRGADLGLAQLWYQANLDVFLTMLSAFAHASALLGSAGVRSAELVPYATETLNLAGYFLEPSAAAIDSGDHSDQGANVAMMSATTDHIVEASREVGIDLVLPRAIQEHYHRAIERGHGGDSWTSLIEVIRKP